MKTYCDRCARIVTDKNYAPLNAIPIWSDISAPMELKICVWGKMKECVFCKECVQSFFDWWKEGYKK